MPRPAFGRPGGCGRRTENNIDACCHCAYCREQLGQPDAALAALLRTFAYDRPRAEVCCELGRWFFQRERYGQAAYWYTLQTANFIMSGATPRRYVTIVPG